MRPGLGSCEAEGAAAAPKRPGTGRATTLQLTASTHSAHLADHPLAGVGGCGGWGGGGAGGPAHAHTIGQRNQPGTPSACLGCISAYKKEPAGLGTRWAGEPPASRCRQPA